MMVLLDKTEFWRTIFLSARLKAPHQKILTFWSWVITQVIQKSFTACLWYIVLLCFIFQFLISTFSTFLYDHLYMKYSTIKLLQKKQYSEIVCCMTHTLNLLFHRNQSSVLNWTVGFYSLLTLHNSLDMLANQWFNHCGMKAIDDRYLEDLHIVLTQTK